MNKNYKIKKLKILKVFLCGLFLVNLFLSNAGTIYAQTTPTTPQKGGAQESIANLICTPTEPGDTTSDGKSDIFKCINRAYQLIVVLGSIGAVFWIIVAGYLYMASDGNQESVTKAKEIMVSTVAGMFIILMTFVFLRQLNPDITHFPAIDLQTITNAPGLLSPYDECVIRNAGKPQKDIDEACKGQSHVVPGGGGSTGGQTITGKSGKVCSLGDDVKSAKIKCNIPAAWNNAITQAAGQAGFPPNFIKAVISKENTPWDPSAVGYNGGYFGLMQVGKDAAQDARCTGDWKTDPIASIKCGTAYFKVLKDRHKTQNTDDLLAAYNWGGLLLRASNICTGLKEWQCPFTDQSQTVCHLDGTKQPKQVQDYVVTINRLTSDYQKCGN